MSRTWKLTRQAEAALEDILVYSAQEGRFDVAETIVYLIDPILERIEALAVDGAWGAKSCERILGEGRSAGGLKYEVMDKSGYLISPTDVFRPLQQNMRFLPTTLSCLSFQR